MPAEAVTDPAAFSDVGAGGWYGPFPGYSGDQEIGDVANAYDSHIEMRSISSYNGHPRVYMEINPTLDADQIKTRRIHKRSENAQRI